MDITGNNINPNFIEHEGFTYLEFNGEYFKGCKRCFGAGHYAFNGEHDRCYICDNTSAKLGAQFNSKADAEKWCHGKAMARALRIRKEEAKCNEAFQAMEANQAALKQADHEVYEFIMSVTIDEDTQGQDGHTKLERDSFIRTMAETLRWPAPSKPFTPNMIAAVRRTMERGQEKATEAAQHPAPTGRVAVTGEIISAKMVEGDYGTAYKILVKDDAGFKVWVSLPGAQAEEAREAFESVNEPSTVGYGVWFLGSVNEPELFTGVKGRRITFMAKLEPSHDDVAFAFGSRPTKGAWL